MVKKFFLNEDHGIQSITSWQIDQETMETVIDLMLFEQAPEVVDGQGRLPCCIPWDHTESDTIV